MDFKNKKVAVIGAGVEGLSSAKFLVEKGAKVTILDKRENLEEDIAILGYKDIKTKTGQQYLEGLATYDVIVRSPGVKRNLPELEEAEQKGVRITSQTKLFFDLCPCPVVGVTGTKGKGTTSSLIYEMLKAQGYDTHLGGNIGMPPLEFLDKLTPKSWVVLELSSFQLLDVDTSPHIAVMLMVTSEHLDYHKDTYEYIEAKRNILRYQQPTDYAVLNRDYPATHESDVHTDGKVFQVSRERGVVDEGCFIKDKAVWVKYAGREYKIIDTERILLPGGHNLENVCAAVMAATLAGVEKEYIFHVLQAFKGLEHRLELVGEVNGVKYYDDSFSTTPETAIAAIDSFTAPEILILGGSSKNSDFTDLGKTIREAKNIKAIIGIGLEWERIKEQFSISNLPFSIIEGAKDMKTIVQAASKVAQSGDVVLLSPACASFDMFKSYKDRGEQFKSEVNSL